MGGRLLLLDDDKSSDSMEDSYKHQGGDLNGDLEDSDGDLKDGDLEDGLEDDDKDGDPLDPGSYAQGLTVELLQNLPQDVLLVHRPDIAELIENAASQSKKSDNTFVSKMPGADPRAKTYKVSKVPPGCDDDEVVDEWCPEPSKSEKRLVQPLWRRKDAIDRKISYGKVDCTPYADGTLIRGQDIQDVENSVRLTCAFLWEFEVKEEVKDCTRNFRFWNENYDWLLRRIAIKLELLHPILGWCEEHYKALMWIEFHLRARNGTRTKKRKRVDAARISAELTATAQASASNAEAKKRKKQQQIKKKSQHREDNDDDEEEELAYTAKAKKTKVPGNTAGSSKKKAKGKSGRDDESSGMEDEFADTDEDMPDVSSTKALKNFNAALGSRQAGTQPASAAASRPTARKAGTGAKTNKHSQLAIPSPLIDSDEEEMADGGTQSKGAMPTGLLMPTQAVSPERVKDSRASNLGSRLAISKTKWSSKLIDAKVSALRKALPAFSELEEKDLVADALSALEMAASVGIDPEDDGDPAFIKWLAVLETYEVVDPEDEDETGGQFGHRPLGTWSYKEPLRVKETWGSAKNACRLLSALLRIWAMAKDQIATAGMVGDPIVHNHIKQIAANIDHAFKIPSHQPKKKTTQPQASTSTAKSLQQAADDDDGSMTAIHKPPFSVIKKLGQGRCIRLLERAGIPCADKKLAMALVNQAIAKDRIILTQAQLLEWSSDQN